MKVARIELIVHCRWIFYASLFPGFSPMHDDVIKWKHCLRYWPFVQGIHRPPANSPHKGQWRGALMFSLFCAWINGWVNSRDADYLIRHCAHYDVSVIWTKLVSLYWRHRIERRGVSDSLKLECLFKSSIKLKSLKISRIILSHCGCNKMSVMRKA